MADVKKIEKTDIAKREEDVLAFWNKNDIFQKSLDKEAPEGEYVFYDGPPFATGTPHYGHLIASAIKDAVPRYWTMRGYHVERQWGWDCHGLPLENVVEKELGISGREEIQKLGVKKFNDVCREKIAEVSDEWGKLIPRFGRWADMSAPYRTMDTSFMESEWWVFKTLYDKGLVYEDYRSIHICPRCETTLSQSEVAEGYQDIKDLAVTVKFEFADEPGTFMLAWTTTPWTLPGNVALAVGADITYAYVASEEENYVVAKEALERVFPDGNYSVTKEVTGKELVGKSYTPPFDSYTEDENLENRENAWKVYAADFVTTDAGTGIAHEAPAFGAEDLELAQKVGLPILQHVGMDGVIKPEVTELAGLSVKPIDDHQATDVEVIKYLAGKDLLFSKEKYEHSYPHCWRCDTPLLNYATSSWFVAVEKVRSQLLKYAEEINWSPTHIKKGRWGNWLEGARDWSISRQRFWANTIPVWRCQKCEKQDVFGSIGELKDASGVEVDDLHKDVVDEVKYDCTCGGSMSRVPDVLDTWFNSGSVPFASYHYPFENKDVVEKRIPADFIAEGADQTRAWFYYQHVLVGGAFEKPAFKNVIVNGLVLAEDGKKMAKKLKNYPDPTKVLNTYGADAMRMYMLASPVVRTEDLSFSEQGVAEMSRKVFGRLVNVYEFYALQKDEQEHEAKAHDTNVLDAWIVERLHQVHAEVTKAMDAYELDRATRPLGGFVDDFSTWYIRRSRDRFKSEDTQDALEALETTRYVLRKFAKILAPFAPFHADWLWQRVQREDDPESVHLVHWCSVGEYSAEVLDAMEAARDIASRVHEQRTVAGMKVRQPLSRIAIQKDLDAAYLALIADEVNVKEVVVDTSASEEVILDTTLTPELQEEGTLRDVIRAIQGARKEAEFVQGQEANARISGPPETLVLLSKHADAIFEATHVRAEAGEHKPELGVELS